jgi:hypothetical protein
MALARNDKVIAMRPVLLSISLVVATTTACPGWAQDAGPIRFNFQAVAELAGADAAAEVAAALTAKSDPLRDPGLYAPISVEPTSPRDPAQGLQLLYGRGDIVISPSAQETLVAWIDSFLTPASKVEILSYSGSLNPTHQTSGDAQGPAMLARHEAIRTAFKRAIVVRDILTQKGIASGNIVVRALGPSSDGGPVERIDVVIANTGAH